MDILVIDVGTTRVKVAVVTENGEIVDFESEFIKNRHTSPLCGTPL